jgi:hypothetical protein
VLVLAGASALGCWRCGVLRAQCGATVVEIDASVGTVEFY